MKTITFNGMAALCALLFAVTVGPAFAAEKNYTNSIGMEFALIPAGTHERKSEPTKNIFDEVVPSKVFSLVTVSKPFYLGKCEVTQEQWYAVMGNNPAKFKGRTRPVEQVSWEDVQIFIRKLNQKEGHNRYRLPTEAEWEHAARAGTKTEYFFGNNAGSLGNYAWFSDNSGQQTHPVGQKQPNPWGLHDIYGNVWEWVQDWYDNNYPQRNVIDPTGPTSGSYRVLRGGSWQSGDHQCHSAYRPDGSPARDDRLGFRLLLSPGQ